jgi:Ni/Co efflux regulator RcnB
LNDHRTEVFATWEPIMKTHSYQLKRALASMLAATLLAGPAMAERDGDFPLLDNQRVYPSWRTQHRDGRYEDWRRDDHNRWRRDRDGPYDGRRGYFEDRHRVIVHDYYVREYRHGRCPPGLAKKHNGCLPPGHARQWQYGQPLPRGIVYYEVEPVLVTRIGYPPPGYRYVRVASDILLIAIGTGLIVDAIQDLSW